MHSMHVYGPTHVHGPQPLEGPHAPRPQPAAPPSAAQPVDELALSEGAQLVDRVQQLPEIRADRVAAIRAELAAGTYLTPDRLDAAVERLLDEIG
jgi:negative regulator of flagellin synthesis FlgM